MGEAQAKVKCNGKEMGEGHPLIYLYLDKETVTCPYCSKKFTKQDMLKSE